MTLAILCSGQGRQDRAMLGLLAGSSPAAPIPKEVSDVLRTDVIPFLAEADDAALSANRTAKCFPCPRPRLRSLHRSPRSRLHRKL